MRPLVFYFLLLTLAGQIHSAPTVFILGDMEKPTGDEPVQSVPSFFQDGAVTLHGAGNEVVAFQILLAADLGHAEEGLDLRVSDLKSPRATLPARSTIQLFLAHYLTSANASYDWFPPGSAGALPWRGRAWPDALLPFSDPYAAEAVPVAAPFGIHPSEHRNQAVWVDVLIPKDAPAGLYHAQIELLQKGAAYRQIPLTLQVHPFNLPDASHVDAFGELYRENGVMFDSGVKFKLHPERDWPVYKRYLQMAHAHRFLATYRQESGPRPRTLAGAPADAPAAAWGRDWGLYTPYIKPILDGSLFTAKEGYRGPSLGAPPSFFPAPFIETFYGAAALRDQMNKNHGAIAPALLATWKANAAAFWAEARRQGWEKTRFFAYILDEVDGGQDEGAQAGDGASEATLFHHGMAQIQQALDAGAGAAGRIQLVWTSHADPARWAGTPADLRGTISWWIPNAHALDLDFFRPLLAGALRPPGRPRPTVWFYHSGQPAIGNHTINQLGIDLRLWGLACARYGVGGSFWWSMMAFARNYDDPLFNPYDNPIYKTGDTRWGNGVLFYPGSRLKMIGCANNIAGPVSSMRMKAYRRGLQDCEYVWLARQRGRGAEAQALLEKIIPAAFSEAPKGSTPGRWSQNPADYYALRQRLADLIEQP
jgi:hypothetical protein